MTLLRVPYTEITLGPTEAFPQGKVADIPAIRTSITTITEGRTAFSFLSVVDSGADDCIFPALYGRQIGLDVEAGAKTTTAGVTGPGITYYHNVKVLVLIEGKAYNFDCYAGFMTGLDNIGVGLLGRSGFFNLFQKVCFDNQARMIEFTAN